MRPLKGLLFATVAACSVSREAPPSSNVVTWNAVSTAARPAADGGSLFDVTLTAEVANGWKLYSLTQKGGGPVPMSVSATPDAQIEAPIDGPGATKAIDPNFGIETETYTGSPVFHLTVKVPAADSAKPIELKVRSQACSDKLCLPARTATVAVEPGAATR